MSLRVSTTVWERSRARGSTRLVMLALADHAGDDGRAWPSAGRLARLTLLDIRNVQRALARLAENGEIVAVGRGKRGVVIYELRPGGGTSQPPVEASYVEPPDLRRRRPTAGASYGGNSVGPTADAPYVPTAEAPYKPSMNRQYEPSKAAVAECQQAIDEWNVVAGEVGLPPVRRLTTTRQAKLAARLEDAGGIHGWRAALTKIQETPGLRGQNDRRWRVDFDWLVCESNFTKLMEGNYDDWGTAPANGAGRPGSSSSRKRANYDAFFTGLAAAARGKRDA